MQAGAAVESWYGLKGELIRIFDRKVPFYRIMQKIDARKWNPAKESFDEYAIEKLALMHRVDLPEQDRIHLLVGRIQQTALKMTALSITEDRLDSFLERMRKITQGTSDGERSSNTSAQLSRHKEETCKNCGRKGHGYKVCRAEVSCFYCKSKGYRWYDCPVLKKKDAVASSKSSRASGIAAAVDESELLPSPDTVGVVQKTAGDLRLVIEEPLIDVSLHLESKKQFTVLVDTGSPVSFIKSCVYFRSIEPFKKMSGIVNNLRNLSNEPLDILGTITLDLTLNPIGQRKFQIRLYVLHSSAFQGDLIIGREFLTQERLILIYNPAAKGDREKLNLFANLPLCIEDSEQHETIEDVMNSHEIDFDREDKERLQRLVVDISKRPVEIIDDDYSV